MARESYGISERSEVNKKYLNRDVRLASQKFLEMLRTRESGIWYMFFGLASLVFPTLSFFLFVLALPFLIVSYKYMPSLPFYIPASSSLLYDPNDKNPSTKKASSPSGTFYIGVHANTGEQIWLTDSVVRQHFFYAGTTGSGKTESLTGMLINSFIYSSGFIMIDGKADMKLPAKMLAIAHRFIRTDDVYIINYIRGGVDYWEADTTFKSNTFNPLKKGSHSSITELLKSLLNGDGDIWSKRADDFISGITKPLVYKRDRGELNLTLQHYVHYLGLKELGILCGDTSLADEFKSEIYNFVRTLPGMDSQSFELIKKGQDLKGNSTVYDQFGFITMQIIPLLNMLRGDYGYIFNTIAGNVQMADIVASRRMLMVLIPALEKSSSGLAALGRIVVSATKDMMASGLGNEYEGDLKRILERRFTSSDTCFPCICDEGGYYFVEGAFAPMFAQARSLGISMTLALQDTPALERAGEKAKSEAQSVISNANTKIAGRLEDEATQRIFITRGGKAKHGVNEQLEHDKESNFEGKIENSIRIAESERLDNFDFAAMIEGETIILHKDKVIPVDMFAVFPPDLRGSSLNELTPIPLVEPQELNRLKNEPVILSKIMNRMISGKRKLFQMSEFDDLTTMNQIILNLVPSIDKSVSCKSIWNATVFAIGSYKDRVMNDYDSFFGEVEEHTEPSIYSSANQAKNTTSPAEQNVNNSQSSALNAQNANENQEPPTENKALVNYNVDAAQAERDFNSAWDKVLGERYGDEYIDNMTEINITLADQAITKEEAHAISEQTLQDMKDNLRYPGQPKLEKNKKETMQIYEEISSYLANE